MSHSDCQVLFKAGDILRQGSRIESARNRRGRDERKSTKVSRRLKIWSIHYYCGSRLPVAALSQILHWRLPHGSNHPVRQVFPSIS